MIAFTIRAMGTNRPSIRCGGSGARYHSAVLLVFLILLTSCTNSSDNTGVVFDAGRDRTIPFRLWFPIVDPPKDGFPLILVSHGSGGDYTNHIWLIDSLVEQGFAVAAMNHPGNTARDNINEGVVRVWDRPTDMSRVLDELLASSAWSGRLDSERIGAAGFSSGGYAVLALAGAIYDKDSMRAYCSSDRRGRDCDLVADFGAVDYTGSSESYHDERIKSVFAMAPAVGPAITAESLRAISVPVLITASEDDELLISAYGAIYYAKNISNAELVLLPTGGHFIFLECNLITTIADWFISEMDLCGSAPKQDQRVIRNGVSAGAVQFYSATLAESAQ